MIAIQANLTEFNSSFSRYVALTKRTPEEALAKKGSDLAFRLSARLRALAPGKGVVRAERLAAIAAGGGIAVRPAARRFASKRSKATASDVRSREEALFMETTRKGNLKKNGRTWWQIAVDRELSIRESGRGYLGLSARLKGISKLKPQGRAKVIDRVRREIGAAGLTVNRDGPTLHFQFKGDGIAEGFNRPKATEALNKSLSDVRRDMLEYITRKLASGGKGGG